MSAAVEPAVHMLPGIEVADADIRYWLGQVNVRLRRETGWLWRLRAGRPDPQDDSLPPAGTQLESLELIRFADARQRYFEEDPTAAYLTGLLDEPPPVAGPDPLPGGWSWLAAALDLDAAEQFVLALALAHRLDSSTGIVFASCMNDQSRPYPTVALAQRLWHDPNAVIGCADAGHPLFRYGLLCRSETTESAMDWDQPLAMPASVAQALAFTPPGGRAAPRGAIGGEPRPLDSFAALLACDLAGAPAKLRAVPLAGQSGSNYAIWARTLGAQRGRAVLPVGVADAARAERLGTLLTDAWLGGYDLLLPDYGVDDSEASQAALAGAITVRASLPVVIYVPCADRRALKGLPADLLTRPLVLPPTSYEERLGLWQELLGADAKRLRAAIDECSRRFRLPEMTLRRIVDAVRDSGRINASTLFDVCRSATRGQLGELAEAVAPRFAIDQLVLPDEQQSQFGEVVTAMKSLTRVHYVWGTARAWNEAGLSVLFAGPPGTGKTMGAEVLANTLELDLYRIDLSQVVNKYIGETEKNLKKIFDAAEAADCILFFDEADALFGKRTEVKDAHDRFANIEISYLLERMERFKGLAILASNRRKDLDEAFMRRLRYVIEFPMPGRGERERIWRQSFPDGVDTSALDFAFLAKQFAFSGGHIRSISFNACLQAAGRPQVAGDKPGKVAMQDVLVQLKRELQKMNRTASDDQFGPYAGLLQETAA